jgi:hypothetical protein
METKQNNMLAIDVETADRITVLNLIDYRNRLQRELDAFHDGEYLHADDVVGNYRRIEALNLIIQDFGSD